MLCNWLAIRVWLLVVVLFTSLAGGPVLAQGAAAVRVDPATSSLQVGDTASIAIKVDNITNLTAFEIHLSFDPSVLEVTGLANGGFVAPDFEAQNTFDNTAGSIDYAVAQMNRPPAQGSGTLLNISLRARASGTSSVTTRATQAAPSGLLLADQNGTAIQASWSPGTINIGTPASITDTPTYTATPTTNIPPTTPVSITPTFTATPTATTTVPATTPVTNPPSSTPTATATNTPPIPPPSPGTLGTHVVRWGEWVYCIGRAYKVSPSAIIGANHLWWPYIIFPNQKLIIPNVPWINMTAGPVCSAQFTVPAPTPSPTVVPATPTVVPATPTVTNTPPAATPIPATTAPVSTCRATYVVRPGDTLYRIALRYGTTYMEIARASGISNPRLIYPGQLLCIP